MREILNFTTALYRAADIGLVTDLRRLEDDVYQGRIPEEVSPVTLARVMAQWLPGQGYPIKGVGGLTWRAGSGPKSHVGTLINPVSVHNVYEAQGITRSILGEDYVQGWTVGNLARQLLKYVRPGDVNAGYTPDAERLIDDSPYGYHECKPGTHFDITYYDAKAYYYEMARRLPSLNLYCGRKGLVWHDTDPEEWARWKRVIHDVKRCKPLRNVMAGNMAGSMPNDAATASIRVWYSRDEGRVKVGTIPHSWGRFRAVGLLLVRSGSELTLKTCHAAGDRAVYANIDCIHTAGEVPTVWTDHGFTVGVKGNGPTETCHRGSYSIGGSGTKPYDAGQREYIPAARLPIPAVQYSKWLAG